MSAALLSGALLLSGCGGGDEPSAEPTSPSTAAEASVESAVQQVSDGPYAGLRPGEILALMQETYGKAKSMRVEGKANMDGERVTLDLQMNRAGRAKGTVSTESEGAFALRVIGDQGWLQPGEDMINSMSAGDKAVQKFLAGKWLAFSTDTDGMSEQFQLTDIDAFFQGMFTPEDIASENLFLAQKTSKFDGREAIGLKKKGESGTVFVAADGSGELLAFTDSDGSLRFTGWNQKVKVRKPAEAKVIAENDWS
ncbi:hypothetical protein GCM10027456_10220 [Kineosporia babensis]